MRRERWSVVAMAAGAALAVLVMGCSHKTAEQYLTAGDQARQSNNLGDALSNYQQAEKLAPKDPRAHIALGELYALEGKLDQAKAEFTAAVALDPNDAPAHAALGDVYGQEKNFAEAENQYRAALALAPSNAAYHDQLGLILQRQGKLKDAETEFRTAIGLAPNDAHSHLDLAQLLNVQSGRQQEAAVEFAKVRALDPSLVPAGAPTVAPTPAATVASAGPPPSHLRIKRIRKKFRVFHSSPVYAAPNSGSKVVAHIHPRGYVMVTGITGKWLRIRMRSGVVGFIPAAAVE